MLLRERGAGKVPPGQDNTGSVPVGSSRRIFPAFLILPTITPALEIMSSPCREVLNAVPLSEILHSTFGIGNADPTLASSSLAVFLLGLVIGIAAAVAAFFIYLHARKTSRHRADLGMEKLQDQLEKLDLEEPNPRSSEQESHHPQEQQPPAAPWEKPDDWWKGPPS